MRKIELLIVICVFQGLASMGLFAQPVATQIDSTTIITFVGPLNSDNVADTLYYQDFGNNKSFPCFVVWGKNDTLLPRIPQTNFQYPAWSNLKISFEKMFFNNDSIMDVIFIIRGQRPSIATPSVLIDTAFSVAVLGGYGLDSVQLVDFGALQLGIGNEYYAEKLRPGTHLVDPRTIAVDYGDILCFVVKGIVTPDGGGGAQRRPVSQVANAQNQTNGEFEVRVYPNPVSDNATIAFNNIPEGEYKISVLDMKGDEKFSGTKKVANGGEIVQKIELGSLPDGVYFISVSSADGVIGTYKIIILH